MPNKNFWNIDYIDSLMIVDKYFNVLHTRRYNPRFDDSNFKYDYSDYVNKNFYQVYPSLKQQQSTMYECIKKGIVVYRDNQIFRDYNGHVFNTCNLTIPINRCGEIIGAIELSKDITSINDLRKEESGKMKSRNLSELPIDDEKISFENIITSNTDMIDNIKKAKIFANSPNPTLIYGETGTGKEVFVQSMVNFSEKSRKKFVALNCAAIPTNLIESTLFGAVKGSYTGAENKIGLFELANNGILFLDELNSMPYDIQAKLLRVLQNSNIRAVGSEREKKVNVKVIVAMNVEPLKAIKEKKLREDLFYRLSSNMIKLIALRDRPQDIMLYVDYYIKIFNNQYAKNIKGITKELEEIFMNYSWNGNVRELKHVVESMISISEERTLNVNNLPIYMKDIISVDESYNLKIKKNLLNFEPNESLQDILIRVEKDAIENALYITKGNIIKASEILSIPRQTLRYKMKKYNIDKNAFKKT